MYARVWKFGILPGKVEEFTAAVRSAIPIQQKQAGFRSLLALRTGPGEMLEATVVSVWDSLEDLRNSENPAFQEMLARVLSYCEPRPSVREEEVLVSEIASANPEDTVTKL
jgi:heme-degrading monooxygenase HmoA